MIFLPTKYGVEYRQKRNEIWEIKNERISECNCARVQC